MNELEFLRSQLRLEQAHLDSTREWLRRASRQAAADGPVFLARQAALAHLAFALHRAMERCRMDSQLLEERAARSACSTTERLALMAAIATSQSALAPDAADDALQLARRISDATAALDPWCARLYDLSDWRRAARIDAEAVFEERRLYEHALECARAARFLE